MMVTINEKYNLYAIIDGYTIFSNQSISSNQAKIKPAKIFCQIKPALPCIYLFKQFIFK